MKEFVVRINKRFLDKRLIVLNELNINQYTKYKIITKMIDEINDLEPTQIIIPGNLYNNTCDENKVNTFLKELSSISDTYYVKGDNDYTNKINIIDHDNLYMLCDLSSNSYNKKYHINGMNFYGMRLSKSYYANNYDQKLFDLIYKYNGYFDNIHLKDNDVNVLVCYDALIKHLYEYSDNLKKFDMVITSNNYHEKEQLIQKGTTLFFLADNINKEAKLFNKKQPNINNIDVLNCEYQNTRSLIRKR